MECSCNHTEHQTTRDALLSRLIFDAYAHEVEGTMMHKKHLVYTAVMLFILSNAAPAFAEPPIPGQKNDADVVEEIEEEPEEVPEKPKQWSVSGGIRNRVGQGTFVTPDNSSEFSEDEIGSGSNAYDRVQMAYSFSPSYAFDPIESSSLDNFTLSGSFAVTQWLTQGGGANFPREVRFQDVGINLGWGGYSFGDTGIRLGGGLGFSLPTSRFSRVATVRLGTNAGLSLSKTFFDRMSIALSGGAGKNFHRLTSPAVDISQLGESNVLFRAGASEDIGDNLVAIGGINTEYFVSTGASVRIQLVDSLSFSTSYNLAHFWTYKVENDDEFRNQYADAGRGFGQSTSTNVALSYSFLDHFSTSIAASSGMPPKTSDNKSFRFPFWNLEGAAANRSSVSISLSAFY